MVLELIQNVAFLVALAVGLELLARRLVRRPIAYRVAAGLLFGVVCVAGMMTPMHFAQGVIYDARSVILSLAGLLGGPIAAGIAAVLAGAYRLYLGGAGAVAGTAVVVEAASLGVVLHYLRRRSERWVSWPSLWAFGLVVHAGMMLLQVLLLPEGKGWQVLRQVGPPVMAFYPLGFLLVVQVYLESERRRRAEERLQASESVRRAMIACSPLALYSLDMDGRVLAWNESAERLFGWGEDEVLGKPLPTVPPELHEEFAELRRRIMAGESTTGVEVIRRRKDGSRFPVSLAMAPLLDEVGKPIGIFGAVEDITERKRAEAALRENEERFRTLVEGAPDAIFVQTDRKFAYLNSAALRLFGAASPDELVGMNVLERFHPSMRDIVARRIEQLNRDKKAVAMAEEECLRLDGTSVPVEVSAVPTVYNGRVGAIVFVRDVSERKRLRDQLAHSQKMEAVGRLAGGVAHDFNNMLQVILSYSDMLLSELDPGHPFYASLSEIRTAGGRSADLTRQLLAFARKQTISPCVLDINVATGALLKMLERLIGEDIELLWRPCHEPCHVRIDPAQVDQVLVNLVVNARDAISGVGKITIETAHVEFDEDYCSTHPDTRPGRYEMLVVSDNGAGMDRDILNQVFEPFFTTKRRGKGTGLGLATVYGIVTQNEGLIRIYSEPDRGTTIRIYLPAAAGQPAAPFQNADGGEVPGGSETVLLVEDEPGLLKLGRQMLERLGYAVLPALGAEQALRLAQEHAGKIDVLLTDVVMPQMSGRDLWERLSRQCPGLRCLFMSGYTDNVIAHHAVLEPGVHFLQKPFSLAALAGKLRALIDAPWNATGDPS
jgi:PAS domain S-box-containing protein